MCGALVGLNYKLYRMYGKCIKIAVFVYFSGGLFNDSAGILVKYSVCNESAVM
jgi:hypothetical protein